MFTSSSLRVPEVVETSKITVTAYCIDDLNITNDVIYGQSINKSDIHVHICIQIGTAII